MTASAAGARWIAVSRLWRGQITIATEGQFEPLGEAERALAYTWE